MARPHNQKEQYKKNGIKRPFRDSLGNPRGEVERLEYIVKRFKEDKNWQNAETAIKIAYMYIDNENFERAASYLKKALKKERTSKTLTQLGCLYRDHLKDKYKAIEYFKGAIEQAKTPQTLCNLANFYKDIEWFTDARDSYEEAAKLLENWPNGGGLDTKKYAESIQRKLTSIKKAEDSLQRRVDAYDLDI